ncbi:hypothetical protein DPMN_046525 [Dreissena polymorpha]|uniref:Uncharacterized protein n=1 Tax=Dreissena polymorpha TaxID=45954 RepID=A0A9D4D7Y3_DREPO|nr:hypothetical protein DPMN_046525 [Dreissena polymorpha]
MVAMRCIGFINNLIYIYTFAIELK